MKKERSALAQLGTAIGTGLLAGLAGTAAITVSQMIEMKITGRKPSNTPVEAASKVLDIKAINEAEKPKVSEEIHWAYGTTWGIARGLISLTGLKGWTATLAHFTSIWGASLVMLPALKVAPPITEEEPKTIGIDIIHHAVYAIATGLVYDAIKGKR
jgi:hypothetical protein